MSFLRDKKRADKKLPRFKERRETFLNIQNALAFLVPAFAARGGGLLVDWKEGECKRT